MRRWRLLAAVILAAAAGIAYPLVWQGHENSASEKDLKGIEKGFQASLSSSHCGSEIGGVLRIPSLGVVAPVKQGTSDAILSQAVGHLASTRGPGNSGRVSCSATMSASLPAMPRYG
jgi:sortase A